MEVRVEISGPEDSGKTTVALLLQRALQTNTGVPIQYINENAGNGKPPRKHTQLLAQARDNLNGTNVLIVEKPNPSGDEDEDAEMLAPPALTAYEVSKWLHENKNRVALVSNDDQRVYEVVEPIFVRANKSQEDSILVRMKRITKETLAPAAPAQEKPKMGWNYTLVILKPDCGERGLWGEVISRIEKKGLKINEMRKDYLSREVLEQHYAEHKGKPFFPQLLDYMNRGPVVLMVVSGEQAVSVIRKMLGNTYGYESPPGTLRGDFCNSIGAGNLVHASDSLTAANREIKLHFPSCGLDNGEEN